MWGVSFFENMTHSIQLSMELSCSLKFQFWIMFNVEINSQCRFYKSDMSLENSVGGYLRLVFVSSVRTRRLNDTLVNNFWNFGFMVSHNFPLSSKIKLKNSIWPITRSHELKRLRTKLRNSRDKHLICKDWMLIWYPWIGTTKVRTLSVRNLPDCSGYSAKHLMELLPLKNRKTCNKNNILLWIKNRLKWIK